MISPRDYRETNQDLAQDILTMIEQDPDNLDILLFKARLDSIETVADVEDTVGSLEEGERSFEYDNPIECKAVFLPFEFEDTLATLDGTEGQLGSSDPPLVMLISEPDIPEYSVVQYEEYVSETERRRVTLCILKSVEVAQSPGVAMKHYLIQFTDNELALKEDS